MTETKELRDMMEKEVIDPAALRKLLDLLGGDPEDLDELLADYFDEAPRLSASIARAATDGDTDALRISAHTLKSNARDFGAELLASLCAELEQVCRQGDLTNATDLAQCIHTEEIAARDALRRIDSHELSRTTTG
ncbi:Hpt domain-containing protein [Silicimonas sp. MF1-12-2]|uniref:Hpt domain-containing protein n=1 Tax=Silicimonas sp. MF1-12-2 TaxID=3384793 RepID=UPI0039B50ABC